VTNPAPGQQFRNDSSQSEREEVVRNDTLQYRTAADLGLENSGRFAKPFAITGTEPTVQYPKLPESSPWHSNDGPPEEPLGYSIDEAPIVGEPHEQRASLEKINAELGQAASSLSAEAQGAPTDNATSTVGAPDYLAGDSAFADAPTPAASRRVVEPPAIPNRNWRRSL
jgi:hypothetical protein